MLPRGGAIKCFATIFECGQEHGGEFRKGSFSVKLSLFLGIMNSINRREEKRIFLIQGRRFRRSLLPIGSFHILEAIEKFWLDGWTVRPIVHIK